MGEQMNLGNIQEYEITFTLPMTELQQTSYTFSEQVEHWLQCFLNGG
jgi:hypothetical protein